DVFIDCARPANRDCGETIRALRYSLLSEHCGLSEVEVGARLESAGSMAAMIAGLTSRDGLHLRAVEPAEPGGVEGGLARRQVLDPEEPAEMFRIRPPKRGLLRSRSLLARAVKRVKRKHRAQ